VPDKVEQLPGFFPARIKMVDTGEIFIAKTMQEIPPYRSFKIVETKVEEQKDE
jgi:hypothetical protein